MKNYKNNKFVQKNNENNMMCFCLKCFNDFRENTFFESIRFFCTVEVNIIQKIVLKEILNALNIIAFRITSFLCKISVILTFRPGLNDRKIATRMEKDNEMYIRDFAKALKLDHKSF